ncbi:protein CASP-like isoform X1 [Limulus polyphemus]|uniref:Protein CASP-like isoform X1 n=1 Tax=Limulus polyphemus TaxID=6850 RepID=A0ABM1TNS8_LIMPO|nr:protein CASP-like isoform X1 [Limulus polyphemus]
MKDSCFVLLQSFYWITHLQPSYWITHVEVILLQIAALELTISQPQERKNAKVQTRQIQVERQLHEVHVNVAKKLEEAEQQVGELQSALELAKSEFLHLKSKYDVNPNTRSDVMEVFLNDLERANQVILQWCIL